MGLPFDTCSVAAISGAITVAVVAGLAQWRSGYFAEKASVPDQVLIDTPEFAFLAANTGTTYSNGNAADHGREATITRQLFWGLQRPYRAPHRWFRISAGG